MLPTGTAHVSQRDEGREAPFIVAKQLMGAKRPFCREATGDLAMVDEAIEGSIPIEGTTTMHNCPKLIDRRPV